MKCVTGKKQDDARMTQAVGRRAVVSALLGDGCAQRVPKGG